MCATLNYNVRGDLATPVDHNVSGSPIGSKAVVGTVKEDRTSRREQRAQRRRMGLNLSSLVNAANVVKQKDGLTGDAEEDAALILSEFISANKDIVTNEIHTVGINFDLILEWIEKLMPLLLLILNLFSL